MKLKIKQLRPNAILPKYAKPGDAGMDLCACFDDKLSENIHPGDRLLINTGIAVAVPDGYEMQIRPRSGLALSKGITVLNSPGTIDSGYRGEIGVILLNAGNELISIKSGERIAQAVICPVARAELVMCDELDQTERGEGGFGSTGL